MENVVKAVYYKAWKLKKYVDVMEIGDGMSKHFIVSSSMYPCRTVFTRCQSRRKKERSLNFRYVVFNCKHGSVFTLLSEQ